MDFKAIESGKRKRKQADGNKNRNLLNHSNEKDKNIFKSGRSNIKKMTISKNVVQFVLFLNETTDSVIKAISARTNKIFINGSAVNMPRTSIKPNGSKIIDP